MVDSYAKGMPQAVRAQMEALDKAEADERKRIEDAALVSGNDYPEGDNPPEPAADPAVTAEGATPQAGDEQEPASDFDWKSEAEAMREERDRATAAYSTLKGKYDSELPRAQAEVGRLQGELDTLKAAPAAAAAEAPAAAGAPENVDFDQLRADYGDSIVDAMLAMQPKAAAATAPPVDTDLKARLDKLENQGTLDAEDVMFKAIEKEHKDWEDVDKLAIWHKFLAEVDPNTGETRQAAINRAHRRLDSGPIIRQLSTFKRRSKKGDTTNLESQVVPGDDGRAPPAPAEDKQIYSTQAIDLFYRTQAQRVSDGKPVTEEHNRLDALYTKAMLEGRVQ